MMKSVILLMRPQQWLKNFFIFLPLFFDKHLMDVEYLLPSICAFFAYSFAASGIYCFNDIYDVEADRKHPKKCKRPIASGAISKAQGYLLIFICFAIPFAIIGVSDWSIGNGALPMAALIGFYIVMNFAYCMKLKQIAIVDIFVIAIGFVLRIMAGSIATGIALSHWIVLMTFLLALFLAFAKRRDDVVMYQENGVLVRKNVNRYNLAFMNQAITLTSGITMVCYIMYTVSPDVIDRFGSHYVYLTSIFVLAGLIRYLQITIVDIKSGSPTKVLMKDHFIQACIVCWILFFFAIIY